MKTFNFLTLILISFDSAVFISFNFWAIFYILYLMAYKIHMTKYSSVSHVSCLANQ